MLMGDIGDFGDLTTLRGAGELLISHPSPGIQDVDELCRESGRSSEEVKESSRGKLPGRSICSSGGLAFFFRRRVEAILFGVGGECSLENNHG